MILVPFVSLLIGVDSRSHPTSSSCRRLCLRKRSGAVYCLLLSVLFFFEVLNLKLVCARMSLSFERALCRQMQRKVGHSVYATWLRVFFVCSGCPFHHWCCSQALLRALNHVLKEMSGASLIDFKSSLSMTATGPSSVTGLDLPPVRDRRILKTVP